MARRFGRTNSRDEKNSRRLSTSARTRNGRTEKLKVSSVLQLQRDYGNAALQRMYAAGALQAKLKIGQPGDTYEREADSVADRVMRMPDPAISRAQEKDETVQARPLAGGIAPLMRKQPEEEEVKKKPEKEEEKPQAQLLQPQAREEEEVRKKGLGKEDEDPVQKKQLQRKQEEEEVQKQPEKEEKPVQAKAGGHPLGGITPAAAKGIENIRGGGQPLSQASRAFFEPRFGADFSTVRVHTGGDAAYLARSINARAFTTGRDVVFGAGQYAPESTAGKRLMAHELTHVVQQGGKVSRGAKPAAAIQRFAFINENQVAPNPPGLTPGMKSMATDNLVRNYLNMQEFKNHAAKQTDYLGNLQGAVKTGTWLRFSPLGMNILGEDHTQVEFSAVAPSVGTKNFIYEQFSSDVMVKGSSLKAAYEKVNALEFKRLKIENEIDKQKFGSESLFPKMGYGMTLAIPYFEKKQPISDLTSSGYVGKPIQRYLAIAWGYSKDNLRIFKAIKAASAWVAGQAISLAATVKSVLGPGAAKLVELILKLIAWAVGVLAQFPPKKAQLAVVHETVSAKLDPFITSLPVDGYIGDELVKPANAGFFSPLAQFGKAFSEAMAERAAMEKSSRLSEAERKKLMAAQTTSEAEKMKLFDQWRNHYFEDEVKSAAKRGVRYAGMGKAHLDYLKGVGLPSNAYPYDMVTVDIAKFEALTKKLAQQAKTP